MPRAGLTQDRVVDEAQRIADDVGLSRLTLAALADRLVLRQPSLYKHVNGIDHLHRRIAVRAKTELAGVLARAAVGRSRVDAMVSMSEAYRTWALDHPGSYAAAQRAPVPEDVDDQAANQAVVKVCADVLTGYQLRDDDAIDAIRALRAALHGFVSLEVEGGFGLPVDVDRSFDRLVRGLATAFSGWTENSTTSRRRR